MIIKSSRFFHFCIDPVAVWLALWINAAKGGVVQGGSTITQQLATFHVLNRRQRSLLMGQSPPSIAGAWRGTMGAAPAYFWIILGLAYPNGVSLMVTIQV